MLRALFGLAAPTRARTPDGCLVYAVGDIHGRLDLLEALLEGVDADLAQTAAARRAVVFLGDYVDRGPQSREVIDRLLDYQASTSAEVRFLRGNHEDCLVAFMRDPATGPGWCEFGGRETLASYGVSAPERRAAPAEWAAASQALREALPARHADFLGRLEPALSLGDYFFAHAGARPGVRLADQSEHDLMWIRGDFLNHPDRFEKIVVHGHTPEPEVTADHRRFGLDTGAYMTGILTALRLESATASLLQTEVTEGEVRVRRAAVAAG
jgi:serine/threonine protein phosphatase 1